MKEFLGIITTDNVDLENKSVRDVIEKIENSLERDLEALHSCECYREIENGDSKYIVFDRKEQDTTIITEEIFNLLQDNLINGNEDIVSESEFLTRPCNNFEMPSPNQSFIGYIVSLFKKGKNVESVDVEEIECLS